MRGVFGSTACTTSASANGYHGVEVAQDSFERIAEHYVATRRTGIRLEVAYFRSLPTDAKAIDAAAACELESGKRQPHQRRIPKAALDESRSRLGDALPRLRGAATFKELHQAVYLTIGSIARIGELTVYDTALRIGWRFGLYPSEVYLHAGTRDGAKALGLDITRATISTDEVPAGLRNLTASEIEDVLCVYKVQLAEARAGAEPILNHASTCAADPAKPSC